MLHKNHLPNSAPGEKTVLFLRRHWTGVFYITFVTVLAALAPPVVIWLLDLVTPNVLASAAGDAIASVFMSIYYLAIFTFFFQEFIDYYLDTWIVTTERILDLEQHGLFNRTTSEMHIALVQDVTAEMKGPLQTLLDFGDVYVQSAAERRRFHFKAVPNAEQVRVTILKLAEADRYREQHGTHIVRE